MVNPNTDEVCLVIQFLKIKDFHSMEIHRQIVEVCVNPLNPELNPIC
jgi:hypothetical protein